MDIIRSYNELRKVKKYTEWKEKNKECFLAHAFIMFDKLNKDIIQFGLYNPDTDKITTFVMEKGEVTISAETEIFKKPEAKLKKLVIENVKISLDEARRIMGEFQQKEYKNEVPVNSFVILQSIEEGQVYNFTYVTAAFNTLNVKINSETGIIVKHALTPLMEMGNVS